MNLLKQVCLTVSGMVSQVGLLPRTIANFFRRRRQRMVLNELEAERLDRIRNPDKYRGK